MCEIHKALPKFPFQLGIGPIYSWQASEPEDTFGQIILTPLRNFVLAPLSISSYSMGHSNQKRCNGTAILANLQSD